MARQFKKQTVLIELVNGTAAGEKTSPVNLDPSYTKVKGLRLHPLADGGLPYYEVGLEDNNGLLVDAENSRAYAYTAEKPWEPVDLDNKGQQFRVKTVLPATATGDVQYQLVFLLEK
ncbi:hypothetical protein AAG747_14065 [Rapidithrix thailandica]|uniref:Uncharacterized protein n=1 Tax=Rapidithrix thailandica TaxID=413964 RepID=A0AAW9S9B5_9BACT